MASIAYPVFSLAGTLLPSSLAVTTIRRSSHTIGRAIVGIDATTADVLTSARITVVSRFGEKANGILRAAIKDKKILAASQGVTAYKLTEKNQGWHLLYFFLRDVRYIRGSFKEAHSETRNLTSTSSSYGMAVKLVVGRNIMSMIELAVALARDKGQAAGKGCLP